MKIDLAYHDFTMHAAKPMMKHLFIVYEMTGDELGLVVATASMAVYFNEISILCAKKHRGHAEKK